MGSNGGDSMTLAFAEKVFRCLKGTQSDGLVRISTSSVATISFPGLLMGNVPHSPYIDPGSSPQDALYPLTSSLLHIPTCTIPHSSHLPNPASVRQPIRAYHTSLSSWACAKNSPFHSTLSPFSSLQSLTTSSPCPAAHPIASPINLFA